LSFVALNIYTGLCVSYCAAVILQVWDILKIYLAVYLKWIWNIYIDLYVLNWQGGVCWGVGYIYISGPVIYKLNIDNTYIIYKYILLYNNSIEVEFLWIYLTLILKRYYCVVKYLYLFLLTIFGYILLVLLPNSIFRLFFI